MAQNLFNTIPYRNATRRAKEREAEKEAEPEVAPEKVREPLPGEGEMFTTIISGDSAEWSDIRGDGIGGSDVASIIHVSPFKTREQLWCEKTGLIAAEDISDNPIVKFGSEYESRVRERYAAQHPEWRVFSPDAESGEDTRITCKSIERPWAQANLDAVVMREDGTPEILEIKTARDGGKWKDGVPDYYLAQVRHYQAVTGWGDAHVAVFFRDSCRYAEYDVPRDDEAIANQEQAVDRFWHCVTERTPPSELDGVFEPEDISTVHAMHPKGQGMRDCGGDAQAARLVDSFISAKAAETAAKEARQAAQAALESFIGDNQGVIVGDKTVTWLRSQTNRLDTKTLKEEYPEVYEACLEVVPRNGGIRVKEAR